MGLPAGQEEPDGLDLGEGPVFQVLVCVAVGPAIQNTTTGLAPCCVARDPDWAVTHITHEGPQNVSPGLPFICQRYIWLFQIMEP